MWFWRASGVYRWSGVGVPNQNIASVVIVVVGGRGSFILFCSRVDDTTVVGSVYPQYIFD